MGHPHLSEQDWRRKAIRLTLKGLRPCDILNRIPRSRPWLLKWQKRFTTLGWAGLQDQTRRPFKSPRQYTARTRAIVIRVRQSLEKRAVGLTGAREVRRELVRQHLVPTVPGLTTIKRWLRQAGLVTSVALPPATVWYPEPSFAPDFVLHAMDWTSRYLAGGVKVFAFHTVEAQTRALAQTISADKSTASVRQHAVQVWQTLGLPKGLQLDNDSAFTGGEKTPRRFGEFVRLCLYLGIEPVFTPPGEPKRNWLVEGLNGLWVHGFWERDRFHSVAEVERKSRKFVQWYMYQYCPPALAGLTPAQARHGVKRQRLTASQLRAVPERLPLTAGRLHFIRKVSPEGTIRILGERWKAGKGLVHQYVWTTVVTHRRRLEIYHRRSERATTRLIKVYDYALPEPVRHLRSEYKR
jgi:putative transposase